MPLPKPNKKKDGTWPSQSEWMSTCMGNEAIQEFKSQSQKVAVCLSLLRTAKHKKAKASDEPENPYEDIIIFITDK